MTLQVKSASKIIKIHISLKYCLKRVCIMENDTFPTIFLLFCFIANNATKGGFQTSNTKINKINRLPTTSGTKCGFLPALEHFLYSTWDYKRLLTGCTMENEILLAPGDLTLQYTFWLFLENYLLHNCEVKQ